MRGRRALSNPPMKDLYMRMIVGLQPSRSRGPIHCRRGKKKFDLDHQIRVTWHFKGASLGIGQRYRAGVGYDRLVEVGRLP